MENWENENKTKQNETIIITLYELAAPTPVGTKSKREWRACDHLQEKRSIILVVRDTYETQKVETPSAPNHE